MRHQMPFALLSAAIMACSEAPTVPTVPTTSVPTLSTHDFFQTQVWLRSESEELDVWGVLHVMVGPLAPPNPCGEVRELATIIVCGVIHNPAGVLLTEGTLRLLGDRPDLELDFSAPPNHCLTYHIRATASPDLGDRGLELPAVQAEFSTELGRISGSGVPGARSIGPKGFDRETSFDAPPNPCVVDFAPDVRVG